MLIFIRLAVASPDALLVDRLDLRLTASSASVPALPGEEVCKGSLVVKDGGVHFRAQDCPEAMAAAIADAVNGWGLAMSTPGPEGLELLRLSFAAGEEPQVMVGQVPGTLRARLPDGWTEVSVRHREPLPSFAMVGSPEPQPCRVVVHVDDRGEVSFGEVSDCPPERHAMALDRAERQKHRWLAAGPEGWPMPYDDVENVSY